MSLRARNIAFGYNFPTVDPKDPTKLSAEEEELMSIIRATLLTVNPFTATSASSIPRAVHIAHEQ